MISFTILFGLAVYWRRKLGVSPATDAGGFVCADGCGVGRFPAQWFCITGLYSGVDLLVFLGLLRD